MRSACVAVLMIGWAAYGGTVPTKVLEVGPENAAVLNRLERYPDLEKLSISCVEELRALPESVGKLQSLEKLALDGAQDPIEKGKQPHQRHPFPASMSRLKNLRVLDLGHNHLTEVPAFVKDLPLLEELDLQWNLVLKTVPPIVGELRELKTLRLDANGLRDLPDFLNQLPKLTVVTLGEAR